MDVLYFTYNILHTTYYYSCQVDEQGDQAGARALQGQLQRPGGCKEIGGGGGDLEEGTEVQGVYIIYHITHY